MKTFLIFGCSWGCGEWGQVDDGIFGNYGVRHTGLTHYLAEDGHDVWNMSRAAGDLTWIDYSLKNLWGSNRHRDFEVILIQTDISRTMVDPGNHRSFNVLNNELLSQFIDRCYFQVYEQLNRFAKKRGFYINLVGGLTDVTVDVSALSNFRVVVPSWTALADPTVPMTQIVDPEGIEYFHNTFPDRRAEVLDLIEKADQRLAFFKSRPDFFWPDEAHPNRDFHRVLYERLKQVMDIK